MSMSLREQFEDQCRRALSASQDCPCAGIAVVIRKYPGERARISVFGSSISWGAVEIWGRDGMRYRVLRMFQGGKEVPR